MYLCISQKVPAEEADVLSKLLAEVAGVPNVLHMPAAKVSGGVSIPWKMCIVYWGSCNPEMHRIFTVNLPCIDCYDPFHRTQLLDWPIFP